MLCLYAARSMTKCPLTRGVRLREVSISRGSTVLVGSHIPSLCIKTLSEHY